MARKRTIDPDLWSDDKVTSLQDVRSYVLYLGAISQADDAGRLEWAARQLWARLFPTREDVKISDVQRWMDDVTAAELLVSYEVGGRMYAFHPKWQKHQYVSRPQPTKIPGPAGVATAKIAEIVEIVPAQSYKKQGIPDSVKQAVALRYGCAPGGRLTGVQCALCPAVGSIIWSQRRDGRPGSWVALGDLEWDHIIEERLGGLGTAENIRILCRKCNRSRSGAKINAAVRAERGTTGCPADDPRGTTEPPACAPRVPRAPLVSVSDTVSDTGSTAGAVLTRATDFALGFLTNAVAAGVTESVLDPQQWAHRQLQPALRMLNTYGLEQCERKAAALIAAIKAKTIRRGPNLMTLEALWDFRELADAEPTVADDGYVDRAFARGAEEQRG